MKIAFLIPHLIFEDVHWVKDPGGISKSLCKLKLKTYLIVWKYKSKIPRTMVNVIEAVRFCSKGTCTQHCNSTGCQLRLAIKLYKYLTKRKINVVIVEHVTLLLIFMLTLFKIHNWISRDKKVMINKLDLNPDFSYECSAVGKFKLIMGLLFSILMNDYIIVESTCAHKKIFEIIPFSVLLKHKIIIIPNGYSKDHFRECQNVEREKVIISVGQISWEKGFDVLIRAFARVSSIYPEWKLEIVGPVANSRYFNMLKKLIHKFNLEKKVLFTGYIDPLKMWVKYCHASIFVTASRKEGYPISRVEAMAYGIPIITTTAGCGEDLRLCGAIVVTPGDEKSLAMALRNLIENYSIWEATSLNLKRCALSWDEIAWYIYKLIINKLRKPSGLHEN